jgi:transglutaminase-like putative cysteine protease
LAGLITNISALLEPTAAGSVRADMTLNIHSRLDYDFAQPTDVLLQVEAAMIPEQVVTDHWIEISPVEHFARVSGHDTIGERIWLRLSGRLSVDYRATVTINRMLADLSQLSAVPPHRLPGETVEYLFPSRYCPSDRFESLVETDFGDTWGGARVEAIRSWITANVAYVSGFSLSSTDAMETFVERKGVCRDFAHLMVSLARASGIPARFVSGYAPDVEPQDFHAVAEVFLDGAWHLVDPTGMGLASEIAKIGVGRDAADVAFLTSFGEASFVQQRVEVKRV